jgi:hypothetical protein
VAEEDVPGGLHELLPLDDAPALGAGTPCAGEGREHRWARLLHLEEERVAVARAEQQHGPGARADAAHPDQLAGEVDGPVAVEQPAVLRCERALVVAQQALQLGLELALVGFGHQLADRHEQRRVAAEPRAPVDKVGELGEGLEAVLPPRLHGGPLERLAPLRADPVLPAREHRVDVEPLVPEVDCPHLRERAHRLAVGAGRRAGRLRALGCAQAAVAAGDGDARDQALEVPLPRARQRLVEVVEIEHERPVGRGEPSEVRQVRVAAQLRPDAGRGGGGKVGGHDRRRTAVEREGGLEHPPVADRQQLLDPRRPLRHERVDGIGAVRGGRPFGVAGARRGAPGGPAVGHAATATGSGTASSASDRAGSLRVSHSESSAASATAPSASRSASSCAWP